LHELRAPVKTHQQFQTGQILASSHRRPQQAMVDARMRPRGIRKPFVERDERDMVRAANRARKMVRLNVKQIGADHLVTFTTREDENSPEELAGMLKKWVRSYRSLSGEAFAYVAVPERHPKNPKHWHLHVAIRGWLKINLARRLWWNCCGGRGMGNVDVQYIKVGADRHGIPQGALVKSEKIARYLSKYMSKDLLFAHRPDKKRYWRSEFDLPEARRYWLRARPGDGDDGLNCAFNEVLERFGLLPTVNAFSMFVFPDGSGFWLSYNPDRSICGSTIPPPF